MLSEDYLKEPGMLSYSKTCEMLWLPHDNLIVETNWLLQGWTGIYPYSQVTIIATKLREKPVFLYYSVLTFG